MALLLLDEIMGNNRFDVTQFAQEAPRLRNGRIRGINLNPTRIGRAPDVKVLDTA